MGELLFKTFLPKVLGLHPDNLIGQQDNVTTMIGVLTRLSKMGDVNPQDMRRWMIQGAKTVRYL